MPLLFRVQSSGGDNITSLTIGRPGLSIRPCSGLISCRPALGFHLYEGKEKQSTLMPSNDVMGGIAPCRWEPNNPTLFLLDLLEKPPSSPLLEADPLRVALTQWGPRRRAPSTSYSLNTSLICWATVGGAHLIIFSSISRKGLCWSLPLRRWADIPPGWFHAGH